MTVPVKRDDSIPRGGKFPLRLGKEFSLPNVEELGNGRPCGDLRMAWNEAGLGCRIEVKGKSRAPVCDVGQLLGSDGLHLWIDTRNTQNIHRASRYCHHFCILPAGDSKDRSLPVVRQLAIARSKEDAPTCDSRQILVAADVTTRGYVLEVWIPAAAMHGFDAESNPHLGFYYLLKDQELGDQMLSVGPEFPFASDPSLWWSLQLVN